MLYMENEEEEEQQQWQWWCWYQSCGIIMMTQFGFTFAPETTVLVVPNTQSTLAPPPSVRRSEDDENVLQLGIRNAT